jgi:acetylglutamate kinase
MWKSTPNTLSPSWLLKLGGRALQRALEQKEFFEPLKRFPARGLLVHGGGVEINQWAERFGVTSEFLNGQRITSPELLEVVQGALCGSLNPRLVWRLQRVGISSVGLNGISGNLLQCVPENPALGQVGRVVRVNWGLLEALTKANFLPVIAPVGILESGERCNVNGDLAACAVAGAVRVDRLIFLTDQPGILDSDGDKIDRLSIAELESLEKDGTIKGGMFVKSRAIKEYLDAVPEGEVWVANGMDDGVLKNIFTDKHLGTRIFRG